MELDEVTSLDDVSRFYMILQPRALNAEAVAATAPEGDDNEPGSGVAAADAPAGEAAEAGAAEGGKCRLIIIPKKHLPDVKHPGKDRLFGFVGG